MVGALLRAGVPVLGCWLAIANGALACEPIRYKTVIGNNDLQNSAGQNLQTLGGVLRQDRANYHKFSRRDHGDEFDPLLSDEKERAVLESAANAAYPDFDIDPLYWDSRFGTQFSVTFWRCGGAPARVVVESLGVARPAVPHPEFDRTEQQLQQGAERDLEPLPLPPPP